MDHLIPHVAVFLCVVMPIVIIVLVGLVLEARGKLPSKPRSDEDDDDFDDFSGAALA